MIMDVGRSYHIKDSFFSLVNDPYLMGNKEETNYRPHFFCFADSHTAGIYWAIPQSTKITKYQAIIEKKIARHKQCDTIIVGSFGGKDNAFLIQNMFPIIEKYIAHEHTIDGSSVAIHHELSESIIGNAKKVLSLHRRGYRLIFSDVDRIYRIMQNELQK